MEIGMKNAWWGGCKPYCSYLDVDATYLLTNDEFVLKERIEKLIKKIDVLIGYNPVGGNVDVVSFR